MSTASAPAQPGPRPQRTLTQKLGAIVLGFEAIVVFLAGLTVYGLKALPDGIPDWWGIVGGGVLAVVCIAVAGMITRPWAIAAGWVIQGIIALSALLVVAILFVALIFGGMWAYATIVGARLDARRPVVPETRLTQDSDPQNSDTESE